MRIMLLCSFWVMVVGMVHQAHWYTTNNEAGDRRHDPGCCNVG